MALDTGIIAQDIVGPYLGQTIGPDTKPDIATIERWIAQSEAAIQGLYESRVIGYGAGSIALAMATEYTEAKTAARVLSAAGHSSDRVLTQSQLAENIYKQIREWTGTIGSAASETAGDPGVTGVVVGATSARTIDGGL